MASLKDLLAQQAILQEQIESARKAERAGVIAQIRTIVDEYGLSEEMIFKAGRGPSPQSGKKVEPKYRNPATGQTWSGRGKPPAWIANQDREQFLIK